MANEKQQCDKPAFAEVNSALRVSWAQKCTVTNPVVASRDIAPFLTRLRSAAHIAAFGPMLAGHQHNNAVMWDANTFSGHDIAFEAAELIFDVLSTCLTRLSDTQHELLATKTASRRSYFYENSDRPVPSSSEAFISEHDTRLNFTRSGTVVKQGTGPDIVFRFDPRTGRLLALLVPITSSVNEVRQAVQQSIAKFSAQAAAFDVSHLTTLPYAETIKALIHSSLADLNELAMQDAAFFQPVFPTEGDA